MNCLKKLETIQKKENKIVLIGLILILLVIALIVYCLKSKQILDHVEKICVKHKEDNLFAKLILNFIGYASLQILNSLIITIFVILIIFLSWFDIFYKYA